ncbi:MAG TPA: hypothetical protein GXX49_05330 [Clostridiaceae bacterium]|nr:hypothetical protein [Clostridiaceae bacterium]
MLFRSSKGSVSVFQCLILLSILTVVGLIVDISRILVAQREVENAVSSAARSVLASYNKDLVGDYGLFAIDVFGGEFYENKRNMFLEYLKLNLGVETNSSFGYIRYYIDESPENIDIEGFMNISDRNVIKSQIVEYMKYKAPVTIMESIVDKFKASGIFKKLEFSRKEKVVREKRNVLKKQINQTNNKLTEIKNLCSDKKPENMKKMLSALNELKEMNRAIVEPLEDYLEAQKDSGEFSKSVMEEDPEIVINMTQNSEFDKVMDFSNALDADIEINRRELARLVSVIDGLLNEKEKLTVDLNSLYNEYDQVQDKIDRLKNDIENINRLKNNIDVIKNEIGILEGKIYELKEDYELNEDVIELLEINVENLREELDFYESQLDKFGLEQIDAELCDAQNELWCLELQINETKDKIWEIDKEIETLVNSFELTGMYLIEVSEPVNDESEKPVDSGENLLLSELEQSIGNLQSQFLNTLAGDLLLENSLKTGEDYGTGEPSLFENEDEGRAEIQNDGIISFLDSLQGIFNAAMEKVFVVEYILDRFTYFTSEVERGHFFHKGEAEYILWGGEKQIDNIVKTFGSIWFLRFAVDSIDNFCTSKNPHPVFRLIYSLGKGFLDSCNDMYLLYNGKNIALSPSIQSVKISYPDHLGIFLLFQAVVNEDEQIDNIVQLIHANIKQSNPEFHIRQYGTVIRCQANVEINLWFLPLLQLEKVGINRFRNGRYVISTEVYAGY